MKRAVVTGGTRGIGLSCCKLLSERGYSVHALYASDSASAQSAMELLPAVKFERVDVSDEAQVKKFFSSLPSLDVLVNNAGVALYAQVQDTTQADWNRVMGINAGGTFLCAKHALKLLLSGGGAIVNVSSVWGQTGGSCESVYSASKGAVIAFTKALAKELALSDITVNCVCPGVVDTTMNAHLSKEEVDVLKEEIPLGRFATAEEIAQSVLFLIENRYITGQILGVNGGFLI